MNSTGGLLRQAPRLTLLLLIGPVMAGLAGTIMPVFAAASPHDPSPFQALWAWQGLPCAIRLSLITGLVSTLLSLAIAVLVVATLLGSRAFFALSHLLSPLLAVPHAAAALGLAFLIAPSGWIMRVISPWATGWTIPPDLLILNDPAGLALIMGLVVKEVPFLLLMTLAALPQTDAHRRLTVAASLGYGQVWGFMLAVLPVLYRQLRLPVYAVLAYAMTAVEMAMILGPSLPPTLSVQITHWMMEPSFAHRGIAAAATVVQMGLVLVTLAAFIITEGLAKIALIAAAGAGHRMRGPDAGLRKLALGLGGAITLLLCAALATLALWSVAGLWPFPNTMPDTLTLRTWVQAGPDLASTAAQTLGIAALSTAIALTLVLACLEAEHRFALIPGQWSLWLLYLPLLVPQIAFLPGLQAFALRAGVSGTTISVSACHIVFVLPYVFLSLSAPFRAWDQRHATAAAALGAAPGRVFWQVRLPMLLPAVLTATALGFAVSIGQYLPSLLIGGGRIETLTTEAVALSSGGNRRIIGAYGLLQTLLPGIGFALALALPRLVYRHRRAMLTPGIR